MAALHRRICFLLLFCLLNNLGVPQSSLTQVYTSQIGVREATGHNDGKSVEMYLRSVKTPKGNPWCAAFVRWSLDSAKIKSTITAWSPTAHNPKNVIYQARRFIAEPEPGDVFTLWFPKLGRIAHAGFFHKRINSRMYESVEGNTNEAGSREGDGVYKKYRSFNSTHSITRWR